MAVNVRACREAERRRKASPTSYSSEIDEHFGQGAHECPCAVKVHDAGVDELSRTRRVRRSVACGGDQGLPVNIDAGGVRRA